MNLAKKFDYSDSINDILYESATLLSATENKKLSLEFICFIIANEKKDRRLLNLANELFNKLIEGLPQSDIMNIQNEAKTAKVEKYIEHITKLFGG